ncbi:MAG: hypothetical protein GWP08_07435 [Nitrospiraceae bacterium]|nr:hypothetical protein [Nitrospiraceae bacterium]
MDENVLTAWKETADGASGDGAPRLFGTVLLVAVFVCAVFSTAGAALLLTVFLLQGTDESAAFMVRLLVKELFFTVAGLVSLGLLLRVARRVPDAPTPSSAISLSAHWPLLFPLLLAAVLVLPRLTAYPWAAPDEIHHLNVARNLAVYGQYASGSPEIGFNLFDSFDSVGPPVIVPVAAAFRVAGVSFASGRLVMAVYFLLFCGALYSLCVPLWGPRATALGLAMTIVSFASVYLGRTLYGEVPGLAFMVLGLLSWRRALRTPKWSVWGLMAGLAFGLAILCKTILLLSAFAFLGALAYDFVTFRRIRIPHLVLPAAGTFLVLAAWLLIQSLVEQEASDAPGGTLGLYRHYLMFGVRSARKTLGWFLLEPVTTAGLLFGGLMAIPILFRKRYDPALVVLFLIAVFYAFWFSFFTPGQLPRYLWFTYAIGGTFAGVAAWHALRTALSGAYGPAQRALCALLAAVLIVPGAIRIAGDFRHVYTVDETQDEHALAAYIRELPEEATAVTTFWPLTGALDLLANRRVEVAENVNEALESGAIVIVDTLSQPDAIIGRTPEKRIGRYAIIRTKE